MKDDKEYPNAPGTLEGLVKRFKESPHEPKPSGEPPHCSFCGKSRNRVKVLVAGPSVYICDECVSTCQYVIDKTLSQ
ncbi:ClpX C4-type zinc finger protein [Thiogranum longum]